MYLVFLVDVPIVSSRFSLQILTGVEHPDGVVLGRLQSAHVELDPRIIFQ